MSPLTFRNSRITYYGPHECTNCGVPIVKMASEFGGTSFTNPEGPIYPNTEWHPHVCDPALVKKRIGGQARQRVKIDWPHAEAMQIGELGFIILAHPIHKPEHTLVISPNHTFIDTEAAAWQEALRRQDEGLPTWHIDLTKYGPDSKFGDDLDRLPECSH